MEGNRVKKCEKKRYRSSERSRKANWTKGELKLK
jgi:hypothetical protein